MFSTPRGVENDMIKAKITDKDALEMLEIKRLCSYLYGEEWVNLGIWGKRADIFSKKIDGREWELLVPHNDEIADYANVMAEIISILATVEDRSELDVFEDLGGNIGA